MKAAVVYELGKSPAYREFDEPVPRDDEVRVAVTASALTNFTRIRAAGEHYSSSAHPPFVPGIDGIGRLDDGSPQLRIPRRDTAHSPHGRRRRMVDREGNTPRRFTVTQ